MPLGEKQLPVDVTSTNPTPGTSEDEVVRSGQQLRESRDEETLDNTRTSLAESIDRPPGPDEGLSPAKTYDPLSFPVIALLMCASVFGVLARLGLSALMSYPGHSVFPLAYAQAVGCLVMGFALGMKEEIGQL